MNVMDSKYDRLVTIYDSLLSGTNQPRFLQENEQYISALKTPRSPSVPDFFGSVASKHSSASHFTKIHVLDEALALLKDAKFSHDVIQLTRGFIQNGSFEVLIDRAKFENCEVMTRVSDLKIFITRTGRIKASVIEMGRGKFKTTRKVILVGTPCINDFRKEDKRTQAYSITRSVIGWDPSTDKILNNELEINMKLKELKKSDPKSFSHVLVSKRVVDLSTGQKGIISEFCNGGDFDQIIGTTEFETMKLEKKFQLCAQIAKGVAQLHRAGIVHRDLHTGNILIKRDSSGTIVQIKIADFGLSSFIEPEKRYYPLKLIAALLPPNFTKAINLDEEIYSTKLDVYQLAVTYYLIFIGKKQKDLRSVMLLNKEKQPAQWSQFSTLPAQVQSLLTRMLNLDPILRPSMTEVAAAFKSFAKNK